MKQTLGQIIAYIRGIWRYRWQAIVVAWVVVLGGWIAMPHLVPSVPDYTARAQIYVDTESVLQPLLKGLTVEIEPSGQLGLMTRQLMSRPNLEQVVRQVGLDRQGPRPRSLGIALEQLRSNISLQAERTNSDAKYINFYVISYINKDPQLAKQVVQELITAFAENTVGEIRRDADRARRFIEQQIKDYGEQLATSENRLQEFKRQYADVLPAEGKGYFERLQAMQAADKKVELQIRETESRRNALQAQLKKTPAVQRAVSMDGKPVLSPLESRFLELQTKLDQLLLKFTEAHPDVIETRDSIAELEQQVGLKSGVSVPTVANPVYQQLKTKLDEVEESLAGLRTKQEEYRRRVQALEQQKETLPLVEAELQSLNRDYEINQKSYQDLVARRQSMEMSESVEQTSENKKFRVIEPPNVPVDSILNASRQQQLFLTTGVLAAGLAAGLALALVLTQLRPSVYSQRALNELTGLPVLGVISRVSTPSVRVRRGLGLVAFAATGIMMIIAYGAVLFVQLSSTDVTGIPLIAGVMRSLGGGG